MSFSHSSLASRMMPAAACLELGRNYLGYEINPEYFGIAEKRILDTRAAERMIKNTQNQE